MAGKISMTASAGPKEGLQGPVSIYVSATNDLGIGMNGFAKTHFELELLHPVLDDEEQRRFKPKLSKLDNLGSGLYRVLFGNAVKNGVFLSGPIILSLRIRKLTGGLGSDAGQTLVSFEL